MERVAAIAAGREHSLAIRDNGSLWAWGGNYFGQLGDGTTIERHRPVRVMGQVAAIATGSHHALALKTDGSLWAWGNNFYAALGDGTTIDRVQPVRVVGFGPVLQPTVPDNAAANAMP
jgi:alpha-tubulin suppressor-like RCC1 family protein